MNYHLYTDPVGIFLILYSIAALALIAERIKAGKKLKALSKKMAVK